MGKEKATGQIAEKVVLIIIFITTLFVSTYKTQTEFMGDDDYRWNRRYVNYCLWDIFPDQHNTQEYKRWAIRNLNIFFGDVHGPGVGLIYGPIIGAFSLLGFPISKELIHFPSAIMAALTCCLLFILFRKHNVTIVMSIIGSLLLIVSPIYVFNARGNGTTWRIAIPLMQIISLIMIQRLAQGSRRAPLYVGLCFLYIVMTDVLCFLSIPALIAAIILSRLSHNGEKPLKIAFRNAWSQSKNLLKPKIIWMPAVLMMILNVAGTLAAWLWDLGYTTSLRQLLSHRGTIVSYAGIYPYWKAVYVQLAWLFGEITPLYIFLLIGLIILRFYKRLFFEQSEYFALIACCGFGSLWYVLTDIQSGWYATASGYQIYLLVPLIILITLSVEKVRKYISLRAVVLAGFLCPLLVSALFAQFGTIWRYKEFLLLSEVDAVQARSWGTKDCNGGTKAAGFLVREIFNELHKNKYSGKVEIEASLWSNSFTAFAGLQRNGMRYKREYGIDVVIPDKKANDSQLPLSGEIRNLDPLCYVIRLYPENDISDVGGCDYYRINNSNTRLVGLYVTPPLQTFNDMLKPGIYQVDSLDALFDKKYTHLKDLFYDY